MTKTRAKTGVRETLKDGIVSKLQRHIVTQRKLLIVINLFSSRFMTTDSLRKLLRDDSLISVILYSTSFLSFFSNYLKNIYLL